jgi:putative restriction endonuclease
LDKTLNHYIRSFKHLRLGVTKYGPAPHKPILLLSILQNIQRKVIATNQIFITPELVFLFKSNWANLVATRHVCNFALPFFHLKGEKFWHLIPKPGYEALLLINNTLYLRNEK